MASSLAAATVPLKAISLTDLTTTVETPSDAMNLGEQQRTEEPISHEKSAWTNLPNNSKLPRDSKPSLWRRIIDAVLPDIYHARARLEEYEAEMYDRIKEYKPDESESSLNDHCELAG